MKEKTTVSKPHIGTVIVHVIWNLIKFVICTALLLVFYALVAVLLLADLSIVPLTDWFDATFGVSIQEIIYTIAMPMKGADTNFLQEAIDYCKGYVWTPFLTAIILLAVAEFVSHLVQFLINLDGKQHRSFSVMRHVFRVIVLVACIGCMVPGIIYAETKLHITEYLATRSKQTTIYEDYYVYPSTDIITADGQTKNMICIYLESMETTYASVYDGGWQPYNNYIPNLTSMAYNNISFKGDNGTFSGSHPITGTTWTMGALFATTSGIPFTFPVDGNSMNNYESIASGVTNLGDILEEYGYTQEFLCGSDGQFAGRKEYFEQHGNYYVYDYYQAIENGNIDEDYYVWWGFEDAILYDIAKDELTRLAASDEPFNFTMLTVDTHHVGGYLCDHCDWIYPTQLENVLACADRQIAEFIEWIQAQPFYDDTVIVITGDHPRMDTLLVDTVEYYDRTVYNCFIRKDMDESYLWYTDARQFCQMDMFPTMLSFMGFNIEGDRLGLGTNLFSGLPTMVEEWGFEALQDELSKYSEYYITRFS